MLWNKFLFLLSCLYVLLTFFEPANRLDTHLTENNWIVFFTIETVIFIFLLVDLIIVLHLKASQKHINMLENLFSSKKMILHLTFVCILFIDYIIYSKAFPEKSLRFARVLRFYLIVHYSKDL